MLTTSLLLGSVGCPQNLVEVSVMPCGAVVVVDGGLLGDGLLGGVDLPVDDLVEVLVVGGDMWNA